jgi:aryl-alcohol dehydrogenase-like predicted oxidoreductase
MPFFPLGSGFSRGNPVLVSTQVADTAARMGCAPAQVALAWLLLDDNTKCATGSVNHGLTAQLRPHTGYAASVLGPAALAAEGCEEP